MTRLQEIVTELGGDPEATDEQNLQLLANEIIILRDKVQRAEEAEGRAARRLGSESQARASAESRARIGENFMGAVERQIEDAKRRALANGTPLQGPECPPVDPQIGHVGEGGEYPLTEAPNGAPA